MKYTQITKDEKGEFYLQSKDGNDRCLVNINTGDVTIFQGRHFIASTIEEINRLAEQLNNLKTEVK